MTAPRVLLCGKNAIQKMGLCITISMLLTPHDIAALFRSPHVFSPPHTYELSHSSVTGESTWGDYEYESSTATESSTQHTESSQSTTSSTLFHIVFF